MSEESLSIGRRLKFKIQLASYAVFAGVYSVLTVIPVLTGWIATWHWVGWIWIAWQAAVAWAASWYVSRRLEEHWFGWR